jgi:hypothetical protein
MVKSKHKKGLQACPVAAIMLRVLDVPCKSSLQDWGLEREEGNIPNM